MNYISIIKYSYHLFIFSSPGILLLITISFKKKVILYTILYYDQSLYGENIQLLHENVTYRKRRTYLYLQGTQAFTSTAWANRVNLTHSSLCLSFSSSHLAKKTHTFTGTQLLVWRQRMRESLLLQQFHFKATLSSHERENHRFHFFNLHFFTPQTIFNHSLVRRIINVFIQRHPLILSSPHLLLLVFLAFLLSVALRRGRSERVHRPPLSITWAQTDHR